MTADAVSLIERDHREMEALFERVLAGDGDRAALVDEITLRLVAHARAEEQEVYPAIKKADPDQESEVEHAYHEHHEAEHLLREVRNLLVSPHFDDAFTAFVAAVKHHVEEEEQEVLPALREAIDDATLRKLGEAFEQTRTKLVEQGVDPAEMTEDGPAGAAQAAAASTSRSAGGPQERSLDEATKDELYELAKDADIRGRSSMTKQELADALREQS